MRRYRPLSLLLLTFSLFTAHLQTVTRSALPEIEPITIENAARLVQLPGELIEVNDGFDVSPDSTQVAVARSDGVYLYEMGKFETSAVIFEVPGMDKVYAPRFSPDGNHMTISTMQLVSEAQITQLWDIQTGTLIRELTSYMPLNGGATFSPDGNFIAGQDTACYFGGGCELTSALYIWNTDVQSDYLFGCPTLCYGRYGIGDVEFTLDSRSLLWNRFDFPGGEIERGEYYWKAVDLIPVTQDYGDSSGDIPPGLETHFKERTGPFAGDTREIDFSPDGDWLVALNDDNLTTLWNVETGEQHTFLPENATIQGFVSSNTLLLDDETHFVFDLQTGEQANLPAIFDEVSLFPANPGSNLLVSWDDGTLHFYGVPSQQAL